MLYCKDCEYDGVCSVQEVTEGVVGCAGLGKIRTEKTDPRTGKKTEENLIFCQIDGDICDRDIPCRDCDKRKFAKALQDFIWGEDGKEKVQNG